MSDMETRRRRPTSWLLIIVGWIVALGFTAVLIVIRAPRVEIIDPIMPFLNCASLACITSLRFSRHIQSNAIDKEHCSPSHYHDCRGMGTVPRVHTTVDRAMHLRSSVGRRTALKPNIESSSQHLGPLSGL